MNFDCKKMIAGCVCLLVISCNPNSSNPSEVQESKSDQCKKTIMACPKASARVEALNPNGPPSQTVRTAPRKISSALEMKCHLPIGEPKPFKCPPLSQPVVLTDNPVVLTLTSSKTDIYDYLSGATAIYKSDYYKANIDIISIAETVYKSESSEEICRLSIRSLNTLGSVEKNFIDPYGYLKDVYDLFRKASEASKTESCSAGPLKTGLK